VKPYDPDLPEQPAESSDGSGNGVRKKKNKKSAPAAPAIGRAAPTAAGPDTWTLLQALKRRWLLAATLSIALGVAAAVGAWHGLAAKYTAFAQLRVAAVSPYLVFHNISNPEGRTDFNTYQRTQAAAVKNRYVLNAALKREDVRQLGLVRQQAEPITWLEDELKVELQEGSEIITVKMTGDEPVELVTLTNAVTQAYLQEVVNVDRKQRSDRLAELDDIYTKSREKLRVKRETLKKRAEEVGSSDSSALNHKQLTLLSTFGELKKQHAQVKFELMRAEGKLASFKARGANPENLTVPEAAIKNVIDNDPTVKGFRKTLADVEDALDRFFAAGAPKSNSTVLMLEGRKDSLEKQIANRAKELRPKILEELKVLAVDDQNAILAQLQDDIVPLAAQEKALLAEVQALSAEADKIGSSSTELEMLRAELKQDEKTTEHVGNELEALQVELRSPPRVSLYQEAALAKRDTKRQIAATALAPVLVIMLVCFGVGWWEHRARRIHSAHEVVSGLGMRILGTVPPFSEDKAGEELPGDAFREAIDGIRTVLLRDASVQGSRVVMVSSAGQGEGKSKLASHLAASLARAGKHTVLLDGDLRRPVAHDLFDVELEPGFSEVLLEEIGLAAAIRPTLLDGLSVVPAGQWDRNVIQALARDGVAKILQQLTEEFDFVVVDSHPVLEATDALLLGQHVDAVVFSLVRDFSQMPRVFAAGQQLAGVGARIVGAVINGMSAEDVYQPAAGQRPSVAA
jgi:capsular exopolysaccharide synthesis family protein